MTHPSEEVRLVRRDDPDIIATTQSFDWSGIRYFEVETKEGFRFLLSGDKEELFQALEFVQPGQAAPVTPLDLAMLTKVKDLTGSSISQKLQKVIYQAKRKDPTVVIDTIDINNETITLQEGLSSKTTSK